MKCFNFIILTENILFTMLARCDLMCFEAIIIQQVPWKEAILDAPAYIYFILCPCYWANASYTMLIVYIIMAENEYMVSFDHSYMKKWSDH